ncbi:MAG: hypothetical protein K6C30_01795, partial [Bacteroidaceae bacterium]|nr:hypothetical protein [Bacteroidaceae bacterium]
MQKRIFFLIAALALICFGVKAQVTTSGLSGKVTIESQKGETIIGANVAIVHEPTGTRYQAVT